MSPRASHQHISDGSKIDSITHVYITFKYLSILRFLFFSFTEGLVSYIIPKNIQRGNDIEHSDKTYDGDDEGDRMVNGLGQLVDGQKGTDNFRADVNGFGKGEVEI